MQLGWFARSFGFESLAAPLPRASQSAWDAVTTAGVGLRNLAAAGFVGVINEFQERRVLALAPHPDDEALGPGGTLLRHARSGGHLTVLYMTDGRHGASAEGTPQGLGRHATADETRMIARRRSEAQNAGRILGVNAQSFMDVADRELCTTPELIAHLRSAFLSNDLLYLPSPFDGHRDHWHTFALAAATIEGAASLVSNLKCRLYEVWAPTIANAVVDITDVCNEKWAAMSEYTSQLARCDYLRTVQGLNAFRSQYIGGRGYAEAFLELTPAALVKLWRELAPFGEALCVV